ncbi:tRNA:m(4)X modification enzyme TRM13 homolog [Onthophagus taurus]|uniref:tRNA:m(4)X modification enzyme TRM13 homolog n=1 Tax=Onthophagus taurus TaxID=166361 RepID=UPI0039BDC6B1
MDKKFEKLESDIPQCKHFVVRKKRFCKMTVKAGNEYCGEHMPQVLENNKDEDALRVTCPLDPKHTCYASKLAKHLKICNARKEYNEKYILKGVNAGELIPDLNNTSIIKQQSLDNYTIEEIKGTINKIINLYENDLKLSITDKFLTHPLLEEEISKPEYGDKTKKHLHQTSSILGYLKEFNLIQPDTAFIEFGAGKGKLSFWLANALEKVPNTKVLLVERASPRHKMDNKFDKSTGVTYRIRADIADLVLSKVDALNNSKQVVGITKHLCGDATDLALRCLKKYQDDGKITLGLCMAFCCHHRCSWTPYTGKEFFKEHDLNETDFDIMRGMVSWSTCGTGFSRVKNREVNNEFYMTSLETVGERDKELGLSRHEKEIIGKKCKIILNYGRMSYMDKLGFNCKLHYYVSPNVSLENLCIVGFKGNKN